MLSSTGVMNSNSASAKSVVIQWCVNAAPSFSGCPVVAKVPFGVTRSVSRSMPRRMPFNAWGWASNQESACDTSGIKLTSRF